MRRAKSFIYDRLKGLNSDEFGVLQASVQETEREFQMDPPSPLQAFLQEMFGLDQP
jgi:hypothetical protein